LSSFPQVFHRYLLGTLKLPIAFRPLPDTLIAALFACLHVPRENGIGTLSRSSRYSACGEIVTRTLAEGSMKIPSISQSGIRVMPLVLTCAICCGNHSRQSKQLAHVVLSLSFQGVTLISLSYPYRDSGTIRLSILGTVVWYARLAMDRVRLGKMLQGNTR
jgi:hypothetical protein